MSGRQSVFAGIALACLSVGAAQAQLVDFELSTSRTTTPAGRLQTFPATNAQGQPITVNVLSTFGFDRFGAPVEAVLSIGAIPPNYFQQNPNVFPIPAVVGGTNQYRVTVESIESIRQAVDDFPDDIDVMDEGCRVGPDAFTSIPGQNVPARRGVLGAGVTVATCDAFETAATLSGVRATLSGAENSTVLRAAIPSIGFDFTSTAAANTRGDAIEEAYDALYSTGKAPILAARLLGQPDTFTLPRGALPDKGTLVTGELTIGAVTKSFAVDTPAQAIAYALATKDPKLADFGFTNAADSCFRSGAGPVTGTCPGASARLTILGVDITATVPANSTDVTFNAPDLNLSFTSSAAIDRDDALDQFLDYADATVDSKDLSRAYARYLAENSPSDPLVGNPYSAQGQLNRASLDLDAPSESLDENRDAAGNRTRPDDPSGWMVGGRAGYLESGGQGAEFIDANFERGFRIKEGSRMRLKLSVPLSYIHYGGNKVDGGQTATFGLRTALEVPVIDGRWVIEPSAAASAFYSDNVVSSGALYSFGVSSRYKIAPIGRGHIVIGNAVNYSSTLEIEAGAFASPKITNTAVRNGIAYQVPYGRFLGRQGTVRASYTFTHLFGDDIAVEDYHEVSLNYGVASREAAVKQIGETLRFGINGAFGKDFTAVSLTAGYRF